MQIEYECGCVIKFCEEHEAIGLGKPFVLKNKIEVNPKKLNPMSAEYQIQMAQTKGYDLSKCIHDVANASITEFHQCPKKSGYDLYCKQHAKQHPE